MNRREMMLAAAAMGLAPGAALAAADLKTAAKEAWIYGLPMIEMATTRARGLGNPTAQINRFLHARQLATPASRAVTAPNNDTLYSTAWIDLSKGPVTLTMPPAGDRYISVAVMNMFTDNDAVLGTRTTGPKGGRFTIVGPGQPGGGPDVVRVATPQAWVLGRTLIDGAADLPAAHKVQNGLTLEGPGGFSYAPPVGRQAPALEYLASVAALLRANPAPATDAALFERIAPLGLTATGGFDPARFSPAEIAQIEAGVAEAKLAVRAGFTPTIIGGWTYPPTSLGDFGQSYLFRAAVALGGLAALPPAEAMYMHPEGEKGRMFSGDAYQIHFAPGQLPPVDGFWSLTMYEATPEGQFFLVENPAKRYAIGDRTPGLAKNPDGSMDLWISRKDPGGARSANWLPAPAQGPFTMSFRSYLPRPDLMEGRYRLPRVTKARS